MVEHTEAGCHLGNSEYAKQVESGIRTMRINQRLNLGFVAIALWALVVGHMAILQMSKIREPLKGDIPGALESIGTTAHLDQQVQMARYYDEALAHSALTYASTQDPKWEQRYRQIKAKRDRLINENATESKEDTRLLLDLRATQSPLEQMEYEAIKLADDGKVAEAIALLQSSTYADLRTALEQTIESHAQKIHDAYGQALTNATQAVDAASHQMRSLVESSQRLVSVFVIIAIVLALGSGFLIARSISTPLRALRIAAGEIGRGRLDVDVATDTDDEIGQLATSFKKMANDLKRTTTSVDNLTWEINERQKAEENARCACRELEMTNRELRHMQSQLVQAEKLAGIGQLAAGVAHELNTPIGFVSCNFETLEKYVTRMWDILDRYDELVADIDHQDAATSMSVARCVAEKRHSMRIDFIREDIAGLFDDCREGLRRVTDIVQTLKDFARIDQVGAFDEYDINEGIRSTLVVTRNELKWHVEVELELSKVPPVVCCPGQINQVLLNLIMNAAQAIESQGRKEKGRIQIRTYATEEQVVCEITDDGPGIEPAVQLKIFDPFFTTKPVGEGTGLGLSVSHDIVVRKHKGELLVDSVVGEGTMFTLRLPQGKLNAKSEAEAKNDDRKNCSVCG